LLNEVKSKISASLLRELITSFREAKKLECRRRITICFAA
jgi:hypothetical protein